MKIPKYIKGLEALGIIGLPTSTGKEYRLSVEVLPDSFDKLTGRGKAVVNTPAGLGWGNPSSGFPGIDLTVVERDDHEYSMVFRENVDGELEPLYVAVCPLCGDDPASNPPGK